MKLRWFIFGALFVCAIAAIGLAVPMSRARGWSALERPTLAERWISRRMRSAALPGDAKSLSNPMDASPQVLAEARAHWADHCASCHSNDGSGDTLMGKHMYPPAPDMRQSGTQQMTDGELFYIIQNGIRLTGMPAWGASGNAGHDAEDSWKLVHFIRHLPQLTFEEKQEMEKLNPKGPEDRKEEEEEEKFLKGEENEPQPQTHHHH